VIPFNRRQLRLTACVALFAWLFALVSGVANACLTQPYARAEFGAISSQTNPGVGGAAGPMEVQVQHVLHHDATVAEQEEHGSHSAKAGCLKFCADQSSAVTKSTTPQAETGDPFVVATMQWRSAAPVVAASRWWHFDRPTSVGPPLFIRLLRLTI